MVMEGRKVEKMDKKTRLRTFPWFVKGALEARKLTNDTAVLDAIEDELREILPEDGKER